MRILAILSSFLISTSSIAQLPTSEHILSGTLESPSWISSLDIDNDNDTDILFQTFSDSSLYLLENHQDGIFLTHKKILTLSSGFNNAQIVDLDNDGLDDLLIAFPNSDSIVWHKNLGGTFGPEQLISNSGTLPSFVVAADINSDGIKDVVVTYQDNNLVWLENLGLGNFGSPIIISSNIIGGGRIEAYDYDGDLDIDLVTGTNGSNEIQWHENVGGSFAAEVLLFSLAPGENLCGTGDFDGDQNIDLIICSYPNNAITWHKNLGSGNFGTANGISSFFSSLNTEDMDNDGDLDVIVKNSSGTIVWYANNGLGSFSSTSQNVGSIPSAAVNTEITDVDGDGFLDVISGRVVSNNRDHIFWFPNLGNGNFGITSSGQNKRDLFINPGFSDDVLSSDIDNDGDQDIISLTETHIRWQENFGLGRFSNAREIFSWPLTGNSGGIFKLADLDGDGDQDIILGGASFRGVLENLGNATFGPFQSLTIFGWNLTDIEAGDVDDDGDLDLFFAMGANELVMYENTGGFNFVSLPPPTTGPMNSLELVDMDNDQDLDVIMSSETDSELSYMENLGNWNFSNRTPIGFLASARAVHCIDVNNDSLIDVLAGSSSADKIVLYINNGSFNFGTEQLITSLTENLADITSADLDQDGDLDIISSSIDDQKLAVYNNLGNGTFGPQQVIFSGYYMDQIYSADLNGDNDWDILASTNKTTFWLENDLYDVVSVSGRLFVDLNQNSQNDSTDIGIGQTAVGSTPASAFSYSNANGHYQMYFSDAPGTYNLEVMNLPNWDIVTDSLSYLITVNSTLSIIDSLDFGLYPNTIENSLSTELVGMFPRCNQLVNYSINIQNTGTTMPSGRIQLNLDPQLAYVSSPSSPDSIVGNAVFWHYDSLNYFSESSILLQVLMPDFMSINDTLISSVVSFVDDLSGNQVFSSTANLEQILVCAYDPNDKISYPIGVGSEGYVSHLTPYLDYTIRFQNTGNDTALVVKITDQLSDKLDWNTFTPLASSHDVAIEVSSFGRATFRFDDIMLPDSTTNEMESQGFTKFRINLKPNLPIGTEIENFGKIYFDQNLAIITNTKLITLDSIQFVELEQISVIEHADFRVYPNPFDETIYLDISGDQTSEKTILVRNLLGKIIYRKNIYAENKVSFDLSNVSTGVYILTVMDEENKVLLNTPIIKNQ